MGKGDHGPANWSLKIVLFVTISLLQKHSVLDPGPGPTFSVIPCPASDPDHMSFKQGQVEKIQL
jgi:hypothetical protein